MELHALDRQLAVAQAHDRAVGGLGGDLEHVGQPSAIDHEGVVAGGLERVGQAGEHAGAVVVHERRLAVHQLRAPAPPGRRRRAPIAWWPRHTPSSGHRAGERADHVEQDAGVLGPARPRRQQDAVGVEGAGRRR